MGGHEVALEPRLHEPRTAFSTTKRRAAGSWLIGRALLALLCLSVTVGCGRRRLSIVVTPGTEGEGVAVAIAELLREIDDFELHIIEGEGSIHNLGLVRSGVADLTIVENSVPFQRGVRTVVPLFPSVLHVLHGKGETPGDFRELVTGKKVWLGVPGGLADWFVDLIRRETGVGRDAFTVVEDRERDTPEVMIAFGALDPSLSAEIAQTYDFYSIDPPEALGRGAVVDGISARFPHMRPYIIPKRFYGDGNPDPVVTVLVENFLVTRSNVPDVDIYDLTQTILEHKQRLASVSPVVAQSVTGDIDEDALTFPIHAGARNYLSRNEPGFLERYAELGGVFITVFLASASGVLGFFRWRARRRKDRIDVYYKAVMEERTRGLRAGSTSDVERAILSLRRLQDEAFELLIDERLAADESFRIFVTLTQDAVAELRERAKNSSA